MAVKKFPNNNFLIIILSSEIYKKFKENLYQTKTLIIKKTGQLLLAK